MTDYRLPYPGIRDWNDIVARLQSGQAMDPTEAALRVHGVLERGIPHALALAMVQLYFGWLDQPLAEGSSARPSSNLAATLAEILRRPAIFNLIQQLPGQHQLLAWHCLDTLNALQILDLSYGQRVAQAQKFIAQHPVPAFVTSHTALPSMDFESFDDAVRGLPLVHYAEQHSDREFFLAGCHQLRHFPMYRLAVAMRDATPRQQRTLRELLEFDEWLTSSVLGADYVAQKVGLLSALTFGRKAAVELMEQRTQLLDRLHGIVALDASEYGWAYAHYLNGRIDLGCGDPKGSEKEFRKAIERGFAAYPAVMHLAHSHNFRKKYELTRSLFEEWAPRFGFKQGDYTRGSTDTIAQAYETAGGDPALLGSSDPNALTAPFKQAAAANAKRFQEHTSELDERASSAVSGYWAARRKQTFAYLASALTAEHVDIALDTGREDGQLWLKTEHLARLDVEDNPNLKPLDGALLVDAADAGASARAIAGAVLQELRVLDGAPNAFTALVQDCRALADSDVLAALRVERAIEFKPASASAIIRQYASEFQWPEARVIRLFTRLRDFCERGQRWELLAVTCEELRPVASGELDTLLKSVAANALTNLLHATNSLAQGADVAGRLLALNEVTATQVVWNWWRSRDGESVTAKGGREAMAVANALLGHEFGTEPRDILRKSLFDAYLGELRHHTLERTPAEVVRELQRVGPGPQEALGPVVEWLCSEIDRTNAESHLDPRRVGDQIDSMLWVHERTVDDAMQAQVRQKIEEFCQRIAAAKWSIAAKTHALERVSKHMPDEEVIAGLYVGARGQRKKRRMLFTGIVAVVLLIIGLVLFLPSTQRIPPSQAASPNRTDPTPSSSSDRTLVTPEQSQHGLRLPGANVPSVPSVPSAPQAPVVETARAPDVQRPAQSAAPPPTAPGEIDPAKDPPESPQPAIAATEAVKPSSQSLQDLTPHIKASVSSSLPKWKSFEFDAAKLIDGTFETSWQPNAKRSKGVGQWFKLIFPRSFEVHEIQIANGFQSTYEGQDLFYANVRLRAIEIEVGGQTRSAKLNPDERGFIRIALNPPLVGDKVKVTATAVMDGTRWPDLAVSEIRVLGREHTPQRARTLAQGPPRLETCPDNACPPHYETLLPLLEAFCSERFGTPELELASRLADESQLSTEDLAILFNAYGAMYGYEFTLYYRWNTFYYGTNADPSVPWLPERCRRAFPSRQTGAEMPRKLREMRDAIKGIWRKHGGK